ncbi:MAG: FtsQ-type POTRA domain-containing protein [Chloroflexi bacterium]|nr:FtsQ-type POTRA domain-containing protein [Chloroflexota bacterium]
MPPLGRPQLLSLSVIFVVLLLTIVASTAEFFYVYEEQFRVEGIHYTEQAEVIQASGIRGWHIFFIDPDKVARRLEELPYVRSAHVTVGFPPRVLIRVEERQPVLRWERKGTLFWVDAEGTVMPARGEGPPLLVVDPEGMATQTGPDGEIRFDPYVLDALKQVHAILPEVSTIYYDTRGGLRFILSDAQGDIQVNLGSLIGLEERLHRLPQVLREMRARGEHFGLIDLSRPDEVVVFKNPP